MRIVQYSLKQLIISLLQQLIEVWHVRWTEAASRWRSVAVMNPLHAGDAYGRRRVDRCQSYQGVAAREERVRSDCALSLIIRRICSDADRWFVMVTQRIFSTFSRDMSGSGCGSVSAILRLEFWNTISLLLEIFSLRLFAAAHVAMLSISCWRVLALTDVVQMLERCLMVDFAKAFDTVNHVIILIRKLHRPYFKYATWCL